MEASITPVARALTLCDYHVGYSDGKVDLFGVFDAIRPQRGYPHAHPHFCVFAQLANGLGEVPFFVDIRSAADEELIWTTEPRRLPFPARTTLVKLALTIEGCRFDHPGLYLVQLFCNNTWVCDTQVRLLS